MRFAETRRTAAPADMDVEMDVASGGSIHARRGAGFSACREASGQRDQEIVHQIPSLRCTAIDARLNVSACMIRGGPAIATQRQRLDLARAVADALPKRRIDLV
jgi:hypothetical protein